MPKKAAEIKTEKAPRKSAAKKASAPLKKTVKKPAATRVVRKTVVRRRTKSAIAEQEAAIPAGPEESMLPAGETVVADSEPETQEDPFFLRWTEKDFVRTSQETYLYCFGLAASVLMIVWAVAAGNGITAMTFLLLLALLIFELRVQPKDTDYGISIDGILIGGTLYRFEDIRSFEPFHRGERNVVRIQLRSAFFPVKELLLAPDADLDYLHSLLVYFLPEEEQKDALFNFSGSAKSAEDEYIDRKVDEFFESQR
jgi:hypothetical protein